MLRAHIVVYPDIATLECRPKRLYAISVALTFHIFTLPMLACSMLIRMLHTPIAHIIIRHNNRAHRYIIINIAL